MTEFTNQELLNGLNILAIPQDSLVPCQRCQCLLCSTPIPKCIATEAPTWCSILRVALFCLSNLDFPNNVKAFHKHRAIFGFIHSHWNFFKIGTRGGISWKKACQDALSHNPQLFESGQSIMRKTGYWRLKPYLSPWEYEYVPQQSASVLKRLKPKRARGRPRKSKDFDRKESKDYKEYKEYEETKSMKRTPICPHFKQSTEKAYPHYPSTSENTSEELSHDNTITPTGSPTAPEITNSFNPINNNNNNNTANSYNSNTAKANANPFTQTPNKANSNTYTQNTNNNTNTNTNTTNTYKRKREEESEQLKQLKADGIQGLQKLISVSNQIKLISAIQKRAIEENVFRTFNTNFLFGRNSLSMPTNSKGLPFVF